MKRIIVGSYMFRYPLGGMLSWVMQYLLALKALGNEVYFVEKYGYPNACYDPVKEVMSDDCTYGLKVVSALLEKFGFTDKWCFVERGECYHGLSKQVIEEVFRTADVFLDMGTHGSWMEEAQQSSLRVLIDGEPGFTQIKMANRLADGMALHAYDRHFTNGKGVGVNGNPTPTVGIKWGHLFHPVDTSIFSMSVPKTDASFTTIMNWKSHQPIEYQGQLYGQKDMEFPKFLDLPKLVNSNMELALAGKKLPLSMLKKYGWRIQDGRVVTRTFDSFRQYISSSKGEFSVCKNVFVANQTAWFSDKSAAYLASGRPVVLQDTGYSKYLPTGMGLFAVGSQKEAAMAIAEIEKNYDQHARAAREIAEEYLEGKKVMKTFLNDLGLE